MNYLGNFQNNNLPKANQPRLHAYVDDREIIASYREEQPFFVEQLSVLIDSEYMTYAVFECGIMCDTEEEVKSLAINFTRLLVDFIRNYRN